MHIVRALLSEPIAQPALTMWVMRASVIQSLQCHQKGNLTNYYSSKYDTVTTFKVPSRNATQAGGHISTEFIKIILICLKVEQSHKTKTGVKMDYCAIR